MSQNAFPRSPREKGFVALLMVPLLVYFLIVVGLLVANVIYVGPEVKSTRPFEVSWEGPVKLWRTLAGFRSEEIARAEAAMKKADALLRQLAGGSRPGETVVTEEKVKAAEADAERLAAEYRRIVSVDLRSRQIRYALGLSLVTSVISVALSLVIAIPAGYVMSRRKFFGAGFVDSVLDIPIVLPPLVVGLLLLVFFSMWPGRWLAAHGIEFVFQPAGIVVAQFVVACAFAIRTMKATFDGIDPRYEMVSRTLGFGPWRAFRVGALPLARSGVVAAAVITWARAIGDFGPVLVLCGTTHFRTEVLPTAINLDVQIGDLHAALSVALLMIVTAIVVLILFKRFGGKVYLT